MRAAKSAIAASGQMPDRSEDAVLANLSGRVRDFEAGLRAVSSCGGGIVARLLARLTEGPLPESERERRLVAVVRRLHLSDADFGELAIAARSTTPAMRNAVVRLLPPNLRPIAYGTNKPVVAQRGEVRGSLGADTGTAKVDKARALDAAPPNHSDVIVLSLAPELATMKLLGGSELACQRCSSMEELTTMLARNTEVCGIIVESNYLEALTVDEQRELFRIIATYSTFSFIRIQFDGLKVATPEMYRIVGEARCASGLPGVDQVAVRERALLQGREVVDFTNARALLNRGGPSGVLSLGDLDTEQQKLLGAALGRYADKKHFPRSFRLSSANIRLLQHQRGGALVVLAEVNDLPHPVIVKLFSKDLILEEARRFRRFIGPLDHELNPEVHIHGPAAAIVFDVISHTDVGLIQPAPTLQSMLTSIREEEMFPNGEPRVDAAAVLAAFENAVQKLCQLNRQRCVDLSFECWANPYIDEIKNMEERGFNWGFGTAELECRTIAEQILSAARVSAVCHGDAHIRNVLVRGRHGFWIDYAYSGPGHPCSDLVRLELSIFLTLFQPFDRQDRHIELQRSMSVDRATFEDLERQFSSVLQSQFNRLCLQMCVIARNAALTVLDAHGLGWDSYLALKVLWAWQGLQVPILQQSQVRSVIMALNDSKLFQ